MVGPIPCRARSSVPLHAAAEEGTAPASSHAEPAGGSDVELDVMLGAARRHGASRVEYHGCMIYFDSWQLRSIVHSKLVQRLMGKGGRTARQRRSMERNTTEAFTQRQAKRQQQNVGATAEVGSMDQRQPAAAAATATADGDLSLAAEAAESEEHARMPPGLATGARAAAPSPSPSPELQAPVEGEPEPTPEPQPESESDEAIAAAAAAAEAEATAAVMAATTTTAAASAAAGATAGAGDGAVAGKATGEAGAGDDAGELAMDERRAEPAGAGKRKRQAVLATRVDVDVAGGAPSWADVDAPSRARAGTQCEGQCVGGRRCEVRSVGSSAPHWLSAPLRSGGRYCKTHEPHRVAARATAKTAKAARPSGGRGAGRRSGVQLAAAQGVQRAGAARRAAAVSGNTAGMAATIMAAARGE